MITILIEASVVVHFTHYLLYDWRKSRGISQVLAGRSTTSSVVE